MSDWNDAETIRMTLESYEKAMTEILAICPRVRFSGTGSPIHDFYQGHIEPAWGHECVDLIAHADGVRIDTKESALFDGFGNWRRAKRVGESSWVWRSDFFTTTFYVRKPFEIFGWRAGHTGHEAYTDDDGVEHEAQPDVPSKIEPRESHVSLRVKGPSIGLGKWRKRRDYLLGYVERMKPEVAEKYLRAFNEADAIVNEWLIEINRPARVEIPEA